MRLSPTRFNRFLGKIGQNLEWRPARKCPCADPYSGSADPNCEYCDGTGWRWADAVKTKAGISSLDVAKRYEPMASIDIGDVMLIIPSDQPIYEIADHDRVTMVDRSEWYSITKTRGRAEKLRFDPLTVEAIEWIENGEVRLGYPSSFSMDGVAWESGGPPTGTTYTITGRRRPEFFCYLNLPVDRPHQGGDPLPRRVVLRRLDLLVQN